MTRELKFRAWHVPTKRMFDSNFAIDRNGNFMILENPNFQHLASIDVEVMQFTGLKDRKGKLIYEGDIVKWENDSINGKEIEQGSGVVKFNKAFFRFDVSFPTVFHSTQYFLIEISATCEVVGNIYDNPKQIEFTLKDKVNFIIKKYAKNLHTSYSENMLFAIDECEKGNTEYKMGNDYVTRTTSMNVLIWKLSDLLGECILHNDSNFFIV